MYLTIIGLERECQVFIVKLLL